MYWSMSVVKVYTTVLCLRCGDPGEGIAKMLFSMYSVWCFWYLVLPICGRSMYLFPYKGRRSQAGFGCVLVVGSSDQAHFSGMALGDTVRSTLHPLLPAPRPAWRGGAGGGGSKKG